MNHWTRYSILLLLAIILLALVFEFGQSLADWLVKWWYG